MLDPRDISSVSLSFWCASGHQTGIVRVSGNVTLFLTPSFSWIQHRDEFWCSPQECLFSSISRSGVSFQKKNPRQDELRPSSTGGDVRHTVVDPRLLSLDEFW